MSSDSRARLHTLRPQLLRQYDALAAQSLQLDLTRGKPSAAQLDLSNAILQLPADGFIADDIDTRNYGGLDGLPSVKKLFAEILEVDTAQVLIGGNSSLAMMHDTLARACLFGVPDGARPWHTVAARKFICPAPGYDRHFHLAQHLGFELLAVDILADGPDMVAVEKLAAADASVKGIWCVPKYSNPDGVCYSDEVVRRLAEMRTAAADFRILWDNAYAEHHLTDHRPALANIAEYCARAGNANRVIQFASTSKMAHPGSGVAAMAASDANIADAKKHIAARTIGPDKVNQLRILKLFGDLNGLRMHMKKQAATLKPKFDLCQEILARDLGESNIAEWSQPRGGYFISLNVADETAARAIELAANIGVKLTPAGATYPYGRDPRNRNIRLAPTFPAMDDLRRAMQALTLCVRLAASE